MKNVFSKLAFPEAPGGNLYEWKEAETHFTVEKSGLHVIKIEARAKNAKRNQSTDDDDLRIALDGFHFGKYEKRKDKVSWKGYGTSAAWNGASLKGGTKAIDYFVELDEGEHTVQFFADGKPEIVSLEVFEMEGLHFELDSVSPQENIESSSQGVPWMSFVFLGSRLKSMLLSVSAKSAKEKGRTDGDNLKIVLNGKILKNPAAPSSKKYGNFCFSGDVQQDPVVTIGSNELANPLAFENAVELWYDQEPKIENLQIDFFDLEEFLKEYSDFNFAASAKTIAWIVAAYFKTFLKPYSAQFLQHSLTANPNSLIFKSNHPIVSKIKADPVYLKITKKLTERLKAGQLKGEIWPKDFKDDPEMNGQINFNSWDLDTALHGIKKIEYESKVNKNGQFVVRVKLFDVYDFQEGDVPYFFYHPFAFAKQNLVNTLDSGEELGVVKTFEIQINITYKLWIP